MLEDKPVRALKLFRVIIRGQEYLGTADEWQAKVVAPDFVEAWNRAVEALGLDDARLDASAATVISNETDLADGTVFDVAHRSRAYGERSSWRPSNGDSKRQRARPKKDRSSRRKRRRRGSRLGALIGSLSKQLGPKTLCTALPSYSSWVGRRPTRPHAP